MKRLAEHARHQRRFAHRDRPFRHGLCDRFDIDGLKVFLVEARARCLAGNAEDRNRIRDRRIEPGDHVGAGRTRGADADANVAGLGAGVTFGHVGCALDMTRQDVPDRAAQLQRGVQRIDRSSRHAEGAGDALFFQDPHRGIDCSHLRHLAPRLIVLALMRSSRLRPTISTTSHFFPAMWNGQGKGCEIRTVGWGAR